MTTRTPLSNATNNSTLPSQSHATSAVNRIQQKLLACSPPKSTKRKSAASNNSEEEEQEEEQEEEIPDEKDKVYYDIGRIFRRISDPFADVQHVVDMGIRFETANADEETVNDATVFKDQENSRALATWKIWEENTPSFSDDIMSINDLNGKQARILKQAMNQKISTGMASIRSVNTTSLKTNILKYLNKDIGVAVDPPIVKPKKGDRGWNHPATAELLCPIEWPASSETFSAIREGRRKVTAKRLPRFLYPAGHQYNPDDMEAGLLQGHLLIRVAKHILQGPLAALERPGFHRGKRGNAQIMGVKRITPNMIAYFALQTRHALSSQASWTALDIHFDYRTFYWNIVELFQNDACQDVIDMFNYQVFGATTTPDEEEEDDTTALDLLWAERARKRARLESEWATDGHS